MKGWARAELGLHEEALPDFDAALRLDPNNAWAFMSRGRAKADLGRYEEALADFDTALRLDPDYVWTLRNPGSDQRSTWPS